MAGAATAESVSVVVPSYNHRRYIGEALDSIAAQTHPRVETVVVDDGSTDGSPAYLRAEFGSRLARLSMHENRGAHAALNEGIGLADGDWIAILNSDDAWHPERLARLIGFAGRGGFGLVFSGIAYVGDDGPLPEDHGAARSHRRAMAAVAATGVEAALLRGQVAVTTSNLVMRRSAWAAIGPFRPYRYCHDWDFLLRALGRVRIGCLAEPLLRYRIHGANTIAERDPWRHAAEAALVYASYLAEGGPATAASDFVLEAPEFSPVAVAWAMAEIRRAGLPALLDELADGRLGRRLEFAFSAHAPGLPPRHDVRHIAKAARLAGLPARVLGQFRRRR